jgi:hypothetical protein
MERGVYFDAWFPRHHCYHPSLPARRLKMVEDLAAYRATVLVWSALGGGSISLPYLEQEAFAPVDPRYRFYGFMNDSEFIKECRKHAIKVFGIVFEVQGWEFPVELSENEDAVLALNELRGEGKQGWLGLREFNQNRYPKLWPAFEKYFPNGLTNGLGEAITDLPEQCCSRDIHGNALHARWVECPDRPHQCYLMDRNNPAWREYLKAVIRIQIDAGVDGVQLDEAELPLTSLQYGGCFCKDCMAQFREYLQALPADQTPEPLRGVDLTAFHYGAWLLAQGYDFLTNREDSPLYWDYMRFQRGAIKRYFGELADYAREYAASQGRKVLVSGNFFNLMDMYYPLEPSVDMIITEMRNTRYAQPAWYRYVAGFAARKPVVVVENPYGGVVPELIAALKIGRGYDLFRMSIYEGAAMGANMTLPYGSWMGSVIEDAFYAPHDLCVEVNAFLAGQERLFSSRTLNDTAVVYSVESNMQLAARRDEFADNRENRSTGAVAPFWAVSDALAGERQPYDVLFFPDGVLRGDTLSVEDLRPYRTLILPDCRYLTTRQADLLRGFAESGGNLVVMGKLGTNLPAAQRDALMALPGVTNLPEGRFDLGQLPGGPQARWSAKAELGVNIQRVADGAALHLIRYDYDAGQDKVACIPELSLDLRLPGGYTRAEVFSPTTCPQVSVTPTGEGSLRLEMKDVPLYAVVLLKA